SEDAGRGVLDDRVLDTVEIGPVLLPVIRVADNLDRLVRFEFDEFERTGADRVAAHFSRRHVTGVYRGETGGEQRDHRRLRPFEMKRDLEVAVGRDLVEIAIPRLARVDPQLLRGIAGDEIPGALHVTGGEGLAIMPFDALAQAKSQFRLGLVPRPVAREI